VNKPPSVPQQADADQVDAVVVGAGFSGLYMLYRLRQLGLSAKVFEAADDVGGTWYWNRYPGARCDIPTTDYTYSFDPELEQEWTWSEKYATQPEILDYLRFVADRHGLRSDIEFSTTVTAARWDEAGKRWRLTTSGGAEIRCRYYIMATGCLSMPKEPDIDGAGRFAGPVYFTSRWPHEGVDFTGQRVAVIGTGSSGIQSIPLIARQASQLTVFQRTANFSIPARNGPAPADRLKLLAEDRAGYRHAARWSRGGVPIDPTDVLGGTASEEVRRERFEAAWEQGELFGILNVFADQGVNPASNDIVAEMIREKIRSTVDDPETAEALCPQGHYFGTKRPCLDTGYFETYNLPHVRLVDLRRQPIVSITEDGIETAGESFGFDAIVYATGFDAMTGALVGVDVAGRDGTSLKEKWAGRPSTYLGLMTAGFPNFFMLTGPGSPSVLSNMSVSIEQHVDWVADCLKGMRDEGLETIEPTELAESGWNQHVQDCAAITLHPTANSWYMGANVPGKPRFFLPYIGGVNAYRQACDDVAAQGYLGFRLAGPGGDRCKDGVIRSMQPDAAMVLEFMATLGLPPMETLSADDARALMAVGAEARPPGPEVGEVTDGVIPAPAGDLPYRLYRPAGAPGEPRPLVVYFHGGGWVLGDLDSDDPLCRDLCVRSGAVVLSVNYRHAPEDRFPAAAEDAFAAVRWAGANTIELGGIPGQLAIAGWSAGANVAAVACQQARDAGGPQLSGQLLICPVVDSDMTRPSYTENGDGYVLTTALMRWFWDYYAEPADRTDPRVAPLRGHLDGLPPACVVTADFDPLRDEGLAYADALEAAGVPVRLIRARGHTHTSITMVDVVISGAPVRAEIGAALSGFFAVAPSGLTDSGLTDSGLTDRAGAR
jgi:cation diffusion facilitator CzcD-associated flavoprotein CzcO/acetyl esterase/lipase